MTTIRQASATWTGNIESGSGAMDVGAGAKGRFDQETRYAESDGHNPETLAAGALAGSYAMTLAAELAAAGHTPVEVYTTVRVVLEQDRDGNDFIPTVAINARVQINNIDHDAFLDIAAMARANCPLSNLFAGAEIALEADTVGG